MRCPNCKYDNSKVVIQDTLMIGCYEEGLNHGFRFTTFERVELSP